MYELVKFCPTEFMLGIQMRNILAITHVYKLVKKFCANEVQKNFLNLIFHNWDSIIVMVLPANDIICFITV